jgi:predicted DNA-binding ribbon-helix-helix protein
MSRPVKRSFTIAGHRTSISLEAAFWEALKAVAAAERVSVARLIGRIDAARGAGGLSSAVRVFVLEHYRAMACRSGRT